MTTWTQVYDPLGHWWLSSLVAGIPIIVLLVLLVGWRVRPDVSAIAASASAILCAIFVFRMPASMAVSSFFYGVAYGLWKIAWIVVAALFLYDISVETGQFEIMKQSVGTVTQDRRLQLLVVAFCFGSFLEGGAGFGAPVAIAGSFMIGLGFDPFHAAALNLIANTAPVAWGSIGAPVHALAVVSGLPEPDLNAMMGRILPPLTALLPLWLVRSMVGWAETFEVLPAILAVGLSFTATTFFWSNYVDSNLVSVAAGIVSIIVVLLFLRVWQPKRVWRFPHERDASSQAASATESARRHTTGQIAKAWLPFALLTVFVLVWGVPSIKRTIGRATTPAYAQGGWEWPLLHKTIFRTQPVVTQLTPEAALFDWDFVGATGTSTFFAAVLSGLLLGVSPQRLLRIFLHTLYRTRIAIGAMAAMLGLGYVTRYSGMDVVLGLAATRTGWFYPFFGTFIGWLGVALTGSDTASNALFGGLQRFTAQQLSISPVLMCSANSTGGVMGKMISVQPITVATVATNQVGNEGAIFRVMFWHALALVSVVGIIVMLYAYVVPQWIPHGLHFVH